MSTTETLKNPTRITGIFQKELSHMIKTLLVNPPYSLHERYGRSMKSFGAVAEPLGLAYLAASLERAHYPVEIIDAPALQWGIKDVVTRVEKGVHLVGITFITPMFETVKELTHHIKRSCPSTNIIVGGPHPSALPERTLEEIPDIDFVCIGEGEKTIVEVVAYLDGNRNLTNTTNVKDIKDLKGLAYRNKGKIVVNPPRPFEKDLDNIPKPSRHLLPMEKYHLTASRTTGSGYCPTIIVARGCPFNCQYCSHPFGKTFRHHSVERIIDELKELKTYYDVDQVNFEADTLTIDNHFMADLCNSIIQENLHIKWTCESRVDTVDESLLNLMKKAGCWQISYGVESGSQRLLDIICKGVTKEQVVETFTITKKTGITIRGFFMLGLPTETYEESLETIQFARELDPLWAQFTITIPYPGTPLFEQLDSAGEIRHDDWSHYNTWGGWSDKKLPYIPPGRTGEEIKALQKKAMRMYYMRPKVFLRFIKSISSLSDMRKYVTGFIVLLKSAREHNIR